MPRVARNGGTEPIAVNDLLVGGSTFANHRVAYLLGALTLFLVPAASWYFAARQGWTDWPSGSTTLGLLLGVFAAAIIAFEMLLWPRKKLRRYKLGRTRVLMYWHVWLGLACLPLAIGHAGFQFGGTLTTVVMALFLIVIASGVWGLALQQILPHKLLHDFPSETIETEVEAVMVHHLRAAVEQIAAETRPGDSLRDFFADEIEPYLARGSASGSPLRSAARADTVFNDYSTRHASSGPLLTKLRELCDTRRRYDQQVRIHRWLHNWLCVHVPASVSLCVLLGVHIVTALKYW